MNQTTLDINSTNQKSTQQSAPEWSASEYEAGNEGQFQAAYQALASIDVWQTKQQAKAADIGCGSGRLTEALARQGFHVDAMDVSQSMINAVKQRCQMLPVTASVCNASRLSLAASRYDLVTSCWMLHWLENAEKTLQQMAHSLAPSGHLVLQWSCGQPRADGFMLRDTLQDVFDRPEWAPRLQKAPLQMYQHPIEEVTATLERMGLEIISTQEGMRVGGGETLADLKRSLRSAAFAAQTVVLGDDVDLLIDDSLQLLNERNAMQVGNTEIIARRIR